MRFIYSLLFSLISFGLLSQPARDYAVELSATWQQNPDAATLRWRPIANTTSYLVFRKTLNDNSWGIVMAILPATDSSFTDTTAQYGGAYEYRVLCNASNLSANGYIYTQAEGPAIDYFGRLVLVVDTTHLSTLQEKLYRWIRDLNGDGWVVHPVYVDPTDPVTQVRSQIQGIYNQYPGEVEAVQLFGHVPVPYSGNLAPDGHSNHVGAWPADGYYGDMDGIWPDASINNTVASGTRNDNVPGDGKFDPTNFPSNIELMAARVDFANMPAFVETESELLEAYLDKDHAYRMGQVHTRQRAIIDDNFGGFSGEAFASSAWRNMAVIIGSDSINAGDYRTELNNGPYQWSYGCGGGSYTSASGIGNTTQLAGDSLQTIFTMLFGSYFGDWDADNNFLRAAVASGTTLCNAWSGRPHWYFHHMAMGFPIGYDTRVTMNNSSTYWASYAGRYVHIGLMGDLTLRQHTLEPPTALNVSVVDSGGRTELSWQPASAVEGYFIYRKRQPWDPYERIGEATTTSFTDSCLPDTGQFYYAVRAFAMVSSPSGSYRNLSPSTFDTIENNTTIQVLASFTYQVSDFEVQFINTSSNATSFFWDFGDGDTSSSANPLHDFGAPGTYHVILSATGPCGSNVDTLSVLVEPNGLLPHDSPEIKVYPNPATEWISVELQEPAPIRLLNAIGQEMVAFVESRTLYRINTTSWPRGWYLIEISGKKGTRMTLLQ